MAEEKEKPRLGLLAVGELGKRDAFHTPGVIVTSRMTVEAGERVRFTSHEQVGPCGIYDAQAVVDPWIKGKVKPGDKFWVLVNPELVGQVVHQFEITGVPAPEPVAKEDEYDECRNCY